MGFAPASLLLGYALILVAGDSITSIIWLRGNRPAGAERAGLALAFGIGVVSLCLFWGSLLAPGSASVWWTVLPTLAVFGFARLASRQAASPKASPSRRWLPQRWQSTSGLMEVAGTILLGAEILYTTVVTLGTDFGWDGIAIWSHRARLAFDSGGLPLSYLTDLSRQWSHLDYPWLVPLGQAFFDFLDGRFQETLGKGLFPAFYAGLLLLFYSNLAKLAPRPIAVAFAVLLGAYPLLIYLTRVGDADVAVSLYWTGSVIYLYRWLTERSTPMLVCSATLGALAAWTKNEGLVYLAFQMGVLLCLVVIGRPRLRARHWFLVAGISSLIVAPWLILEAVYHVPNNDYYSPALATILSHADRVGVILIKTIVELATLKRWGLLWLLFGLFTASLLLPRAWREGWARTRDVYLGLSVLVSLGVLDAAYVLSRWQPFTDHIDNSLNRLVAQQVPIAQFCVALLFLGLYSAWRGDFQIRGDSPRGKTEAGEESREAPVRTAG